jgi:hypothetical protein
MVILPRVTVTGVWQIDTGSFHSRVDILNDLDMARRIFGRVSNLVTGKPVGDPPERRALLLLRREVKRTQGGGSVRNHWPMRVRIWGSAELTLSALDAIQLPATAQLRLPAPDERPLDLIPVSQHPEPAPEPAQTPQQQPGIQKPVCPQCKGVMGMVGTESNQVFWVCPVCGVALRFDGSPHVCDCGGEIWEVIPKRGPGPGVEIAFIASCTGCGTIIGGVEDEKKATEPPPPADHEDPPDIPADDSEPPADYPEDEGQAEQEPPPAPAKAPAPAPAPQPEPKKPAPKQGRWAF